MFDIEMQKLDDDRYKVCDCDGNWFLCYTKSEAEQKKRDFEIQKQQRKGLIHTMLARMGGAGSTRGTTIKPK